MFPRTSDVHSRRRHRIKERMKRKKVRLKKKMEEHQLKVKIQSALQEAWSLTKQKLINKFDFTKIYILQDSKLLYLNFLHLLPSLMKFQYWTKFYSFKFNIFPGAGQT